MNQALIARIENALHEQLNSAIEDIVMSVMETHLECHDFDTQYDTYNDVQCDFAADIGELAENISEVIRAQMEKRIEALETEMGERFEDEVLPAVKATHELDGQIDRPARRESWCNFIDDLNKSGELSEYEAANIDFDVESL
jgi:hypothetical protein